MPVAGNEETTVKPISRQFSNYIAGVPIKKRRFPLIHPSSPQSEERSTSPKDGGSLHGKQDLNISNVGVLTAVDMPVIENKSVSEGSKKATATSTDLVCNAGGFSKVKLEEPGAAIPPAHVDCFRHEEKLVMTDRPVLGSLTEKTDLKISPEETIAENVGSDASKEKKTVGMFISEVSSTTQLLSSDFHQHVAPVLTAERKNENCNNLDKSEQELTPSSSSSKNSLEHCESGGVRNINCSPLQSNRANWDLNTTMDSWEGSECEAPAMKLPVSEMTSTTYKPLTCPSGKTQTGITCETIAMRLPITEMTSTTYKPLIRPSGITQTGITSHKKAPLNSEFGTDSIASQSPSEQLNVPNDSLHLCLSSSFPTHFSHNSCKSSNTILDSGSYNLKSRSPKMVEKLVSPNMVVGMVKLEPFEESVKIVCESDGVTVNHQLSERGKLELPKICKNRTEEKLVEAKSIKSESVEECNMDTQKTLKGISGESEKKVIHGNVLNNSTLPRTTDLVLGASSSKTCSTALFVRGDVRNSEHATHTDGFHLSSDIVHLSKDGDARKQEVMDQYTVTAANENTEDTAVLRMKFIDEHPENFHGSGDGSVSDDEKINIFTDILEEDSYGSDYESDVNQAVPMTVEVEDDVDDDDYEDGEVREPVASSEVEGLGSDGKEIEDVGKFESDDKKMNLGSSSGQVPNLFYVEKVNVTIDPGETSNGDCKDHKVSVALKSIGGENKEFPLLESMVIEEKIAGVDVKRPIEANQRRLDQSGKKETLIGKESSIDQTPDLVSVVTVIHSAVEEVKNVDLIRKTELASAIVEESVNSDDVAKDACGGSGSGMRRIINLPKGSSSSSLPGKTRSFSGRSFPLPPGRERMADMSLERRKLHPRGRDEFHIDGSQNFSRERNHDRSPRNSRSNFLQDRRKFNNREDTLHDDWDCDGDFGPYVYSSPSEYHGSRQKYVSVLRHVPSRGRSPGDRDEFASRGLQMVRGMNRNICASRRGGEDNSDMAGERHNEKFIRGFRDDTMDSVFNHAQPPFEGVDGHFGRRNRSFSSMQRDLSRVHSKSPMRSRSRSPGPWLSPRRSPDVFGHPELTHPRSTMYRVERMRSPDRSCFRGEMAVRRHGSPSFVSPSNNIRDVGSGRSNGHLRSVVPDRSPSGRFLVRNRRYDVMDHRERADNDEYFDRLDHSAQFEFNEDGNGDERRRFGNRRPVRSFRPSSGRDEDNFHVSAEDSSRPFRYFPGDDVEFRERSSLRERDFGRRMKNRPGNLPRQMRSMDEQEDNYRRCGQVWHDDSFGDISRMKRKRF